MSDFWSSWRNIDGDTLIARGPCLLHTLFVLTSTTGGDATVYEGQDTGSGTKIIRLEGTANEIRSVHFSPPLPCQRGLYVDVGSNVDEVLVHYTILPKNTVFSR